jgi:hypothetical protein
LVRGRAGQAEVLLQQARFSALISTTAVCGRSRGPMRSTSAMSASVAAAAEIVERGAARGVDQEAGRSLAWELSS